MGIIWWCSEIEELLCFGTMLHHKNVQIAKRNRMQAGGQDANLWKGGFEMCILVGEAIWDYISIHLRPIQLEPTSSTFSSPKHPSAYRRHSITLWFTTSGHFVTYHTHLECVVLLVLDGSSTANSTRYGRVNSDTKFCLLIKLPYLISIVQHISCQSRGSASSRCSSLTR